MLVCPPGTKAANRRARQQKNVPRARGNGLKKALLASVGAEVEMTNELHVNKLLNKY